MMMIWSVRRRPSLFRQILRSALVVGSAVCVPLGVELIRRLSKSRAVRAKLRSATRRVGRVVGAGTRRNGKRRSLILSNP
jgi:hypothetical protein